MRKTKFTNLEEVRAYQILNAKKVITKDLKRDYKTCGIIKTKIIGEVAYSGIKIYNFENKNLIDTKFKLFRPIFSEYLPTLLFLYQTDIYLDLIKNMDKTPDCYIVNSSGQMHPYLYGAACDFGLKISIPVIGFTNKLLFGNLKDNIEDLPYLKVVYKKKLIGYAIPKPDSKKYLYISVGNNISFKTALKILLNLNQKLISSLKSELNNFISSNLNRID